MRIGEVAKQASVATSAIRFYEDAGLLPEPCRTPSGYRDYDPSVIERIRFIRAGQAVGLTLGALGDVLEIRDRGEAPCRHVTELIRERIEEIESRMRDLRKLRGDLRELAVETGDVDPAECEPDSVCRILRAAS
ncbi:MAG: heavy metal-responsive transcriptional regulator [Actinomycetota bacterium]